MLTIPAPASILLVIDLQSRLMPVIEEGSAVLDRTKRLVAAAGLIDVPVLFTEQNPRGLGTTVPELAADRSQVLSKMTFDAVRAPGFLERVPEDRAVVVTGSEAHVCVLQTVLGLLERGRTVYVVRDAIGSRTGRNKDAAVDRMARHGAEIVTAEMVMFEWLETRFREMMALIK